MCTTLFYSIESGPQSGAALDTGSAAAARAATDGSSRPPVDSSTTMAGSRALSHETSSRIRGSSIEMVHIWPVGRTATSTQILDTSMASYTVSGFNRTSLVEHWTFLARCGLNRPEQPFGLCLGMVRRPLLDNGL